MPVLFTIGHSTHSWESFRDLLLLHRIEAIADVRSSPYSVRLPQFNRESLEHSLRGISIRYVFLGKELGARRSERDCYVDGVAKYDRIAETGSFRDGLERLRKGCDRFRIALMCAEKDPLTCHRTILICRHFRTEACIQHILFDGILESHENAEIRLMNEERVPTDDLFASQLALLMKAYDQRGDKVAFYESPETIQQQENYG